MVIELYKQDNKSHILRIIRRDGSREERQLETKSFLVHDFIHFALESEARLSNGFWGMLAQSTSFGELYDIENPLPENKQLMMIEGLVGPLQSVWHGRLDKNLYISQAQKIAPDLITHEFVDRVLQRMRQLWGQWNATAYRSIMKLEWKP